jgi:hypothetical protein
MLLVADLFPWRPGFTPGSVHVGFVVDSMALGQVSFRVRCFYPVNIITPWLSVLIYHRLTWVSALKDQRLTAWAMARPVNTFAGHLHFVKQFHMISCNYVMIFFTDSGSMSCSFMFLVSSLLASRLVPSKESMSASFSIIETNVFYLLSNSSGTYCASHFRRIMLS